MKFVPCFLLACTLAMAAGIPVVHELNVNNTNTSLANITSHVTEANENVVKANEHVDEANVAGRHLLLSLLKKSSEEIVFNVFPSRSK